MPTDETQPATPAQQFSAYEQLTDRQRLFLDDYLKHSNGAKAARNVFDLKGSSAKVEAHRMLTNANLLAAKAERLAALSIDAAEVTKQVSDIGKTRLNDYFTLRDKQGYQMEEHYLSVLVERAKAEINYIVEFAAEHAVPLSDMKGATPMGKRLAAAREKLLELELEVMAHGPDAVKLVPGKPVVYQVAELDLVKLAKAKEGGRIKSYSVGKDGIKVETYDALAALNTSARMLGLFEKDNEQSKATAVINAAVTILPAQGGIPVATSEKEVRDV